MTPALMRHTDIKIADFTCEQARQALITLKRKHTFIRRIEGRIDKAIEAMDVIITVLAGLENIEEQVIMSPTYGDGKR